MRPRNSEKIKAVVNSMSALRWAIKNLIKLNPDDSEIINALNEELISLANIYIKIKRKFNIHLIKSDKDSKIDPPKSLKELILNGANSQDLIKLYSRITDTRRRAKDYGVWEVLIANDEKLPPNERVLTDKKARFKKPQNLNLNLNYEQKELFNDFITLNEEK